jgi:transcriptional regulator with GAF, ATPase, and Fis domain
MPSESVTATHVYRQPTLELPSVELVVIDGPDRGQRIRLSTEATRIGTAQHCALRLTDRTVSRLHCILEVVRDAVHIVDTNSTNGTFIDGVRVRDGDITSGSTLRIGSTSIRVDLVPEPMLLPISSKTSLGGLIGRGVEMRRLYALLELAAPTDAVILIEGETGTGKEVVARTIHDLSNRSTGPFVTVDCGSIAESLIESELFGHVRGAFSGATSNRAGLFEEAAGGTIFLDEIGELPPAMQPKLLRALESREVRRVGANAVTKVDARVVAATNRDLAQSVNDGTFREDLYFRLAVISLHLPPLRARQEDIPDLVKHFYERIGGRGAEAPEDVLRVAMTRSWPGNVRELRNFIERSISLGWLREPATESAQASPEVAPAQTGAVVPLHLPLKEARQTWINQFESVYVRAMLEATGGNVSRAAEFAGVNRRFLQRLMVRLGMRVEASSGEDER